MQRGYGRESWKGFAGVFAAGVLLAGAALAQDLRPPIPVEHAPPESMEVEREAIVELRYTVKADGGIADLEVREIFSAPQFNEAARRTAEAWRWQPGTSEGKAVDFLNQRELLLFSTGQGAVSAPVREGVEAINALLGDDRHEEAASRVQALLADGASSILDFLVLQDLLVSAYLGLEQPHKALEASRLATLQTLGFAPPARRGRRGPPTPVMVDLLPAPLASTALRKRFVLERALSHNAAALATYERLRALDLPEDDAIHAQAEAIRDKLAGAEPRGLLARLEGDTWSFTPELRAVAVMDVKGQIDKVNLRCQRRNMELAFEAEVEWNLPPALGACELEFVGQPGTDFTVFELPPAE